MSSIDHDSKLVEAVARGLTEAQRQAMLGGKWNVDPVCAELMMLGLVRRAPTVSWPYSAELAPLGLAVRDYLRSLASDVKEEGR